MLDLQILALTLIPLFSAVAPSEGGVAPSTLSILGADQPVTAEFMVGAWKTSDEFFRWGAQDRERARITTFKGNSYMSLRRDGALKMVNLFRPSEGSWELTEQGLIIHDPLHPERGSQLLTVRKRDNNRIWILLPFASGASGIGMVRVPDEELSRVKPKPEPVGFGLPANRNERPPVSGRASDTRDHTFDEAEALIPAASRAGHSPGD